VVLRFPFGAATEAERRTEVVRVVIPRRQFQVLTLDFDTSVVMNGNDLHFEDRLPVLERFLALDPVHEVAGAVRPARNSEAFQYSRKLGPSLREALLRAPVGVGRFVIRAHPRAWGWRAVQSELGDDIS